MSAHSTAGSRRFVRSIEKHAEDIIYRTSGLLLLAGAFFRRNSCPDLAAVRRSYASYFWAPDHPSEWLDIAISALILPIGIPLAALWFTWRNGLAVSRRSGRSVLRQFADQLRLAYSTGTLPPWYYIFEFFEPAKRGSAAQYLSRAETKRGMYRVFRKRQPTSSPLANKVMFAHFCLDHQLSAAPVLLIAGNGKIEWGTATGRLQDCDLFIKPVSGRGGKGAEWWQSLGAGRYRDSGGAECAGPDLIAGLVSRGQTVLVQPRLVNHPAIQDLSNGALSTVRVLTCLDERDEPEVIGAAFRMAVGTNTTVDNFHAGGIAAAVELGTGRLGRASNLGMDGRLGWLDRHPDTGARISGRELPMWNEALDLVSRAHKTFSDHVVVGWDVGLLPNGPCLVEGNHAPDLDILQRTSGVPLGSHRFTELLAWRLGIRGSTPVPRSP